MKHFKKVLPEFRYELGSTVADDTIAKAMMSTYFTHDNFNGFFTRDFLSTGQEMSPLLLVVVSVPRLLAFGYQKLTRWDAVLGTNAVIMHLPSLGACPDDM